MPVVDLRGYLGLKQVETTESSVILVVELGTLALGVLVDRVLEVMDFHADQIRPPPDGLHRGLQGDQLVGVARTQEAVCFLLDLGRSDALAQRLRAV